jgi:hypothetical protein
MTRKRLAYTQSLFSKCVDWQVRESRNHRKVMWLKMPDGRGYILNQPAFQRRRLSCEDKQYLKRIGGFLL